MYGASLCIEKDLKHAWDTQGRHGYLQAFNKQLSATLWRPGAMLSAGDAKVD